MNLAIFYLCVCMCVCEVSINARQDRVWAGVTRLHPPPAPPPSPFCLGRAGRVVLAELVRAPIPHKGMTQALTAYIRGVKSLSKHSSPQNKINTREGERRGWGEIRTLEGASGSR